MPRPIDEIEAEISAAQKEALDEACGAAVQAGVAVVLNQQQQVASANAAQHSQNSEAADEKVKHLEAEKLAAQEHIELGGGNPSDNRVPTVQIRLFNTQYLHVMQILKSKVTLSSRTTSE